MEAVPSIIINNLRSIQLSILLNNMKFGVELHQIIYTFAPFKLSSTLQARVFSFLFWSSRDGQ